MTGALESFLRKLESNTSRTVPGIGPGNWRPDFGQNREPSQSTEWLTHHLGVVESLSDDCHACIRCAVDDPTNDAFVLGAYAAARGAAHFARILKGE